jgi:hypothetical protein
VPSLAISNEAGTPLISWRATIFRQLSNGQIVDLASRWNEESNCQRSTQTPSEFLCPDRRNQSAEKLDYVAVTGPGTAWEGNNPRGILILECSDTGIHWLEPRGINQDRDITRLCIRG